jgi:hypothetical protein
MTTPNANRCGGTSATPGGGITVSLERWQLAEVRRQLYVDLGELAEHIAKEANGATQIPVGDPAEKILGADLYAFCHRTFADAVRMLDGVGWDLDGDMAALTEHDRAKKDWT